MLVELFIGLCFFSLLSRVNRIVLTSHYSSNTFVVTLNLFLCLRKVVVLIGHHFVYKLDIPSLTFPFFKF